MTIANTNTSSTYNGNGSTREWNLGFAYNETLSDLSIRVTHADASHEEITTNYSYYNGVVTYPTIESGLDPLPSGDKITISRVTPLTQSINLTQQGPLDAETLEGGYDKLTMEVQELSHTVGDVIPSINLVADNIPVIQSVAANETNINAVAGNSSNINSVASNATNINTTVSNMSAIIAAPTEASNAAASASKAKKWAEGSDADVSALGGTHSAKGWAGVAGEIATSKVSKTGDTMTGQLEMAGTGTSAIKLNVTNVTDKFKDIAAYNGDDRFAGLRLEYTGQSARVAGLYARDTNSNISQLRIYYDSNNNVITSAPACDVNNSIVTTVAKSKSVNGYYKLGNGLIIQWGYANPTNRRQQHSLNTPFSNATYCIVATCDGPGSNTNPTKVSIDTLTTTTFYATTGHGAEGSSEQPFRWFAIGY